MVFTQSLLAALVPFLVSSDALSIKPRQDGQNTATVDLRTQRGAPKHLASGIIYGIPDTPNQIPDNFYTEMGFNYARAGGAQLEAPSRGWIWGLNEYQGRFQSTKSNYDTSRKYGANFILLPHDIWGTDHSNSSTVWPGDNGDWTDYDNFLDTLLADLKSNNMLDGMVFDIWNEPDLPNAFWHRSQQQWIDLYVRTHKRIRSDGALSRMLISGPSNSGQPSPDNTWYTNWFQAIKANDAIPDQYSWHIEGDINNEIDDLQTNNATMTQMLANAGLPPRQVNINEYAVFAEQVASGAAWWISRLERYETIGLRGNWLSGAGPLHDYLSSLLSKPNADTSNYNPQGGGYFPNGEFQVYKYYNLNMTGNRLATTGTGDRLMDVYATVGDGKARVLTGVRLRQGTWYITLNGLSALGLPSSGNLQIQTWGFVDNGHFGGVNGPQDRGIFGHDYSGDSLTFPVYQTAQDQNTAWGFEFAV